MSPKVEYVNTLWSTDLIPMNTSNRHIQTCTPRDACKNAHYCIIQQSQGIGVSLTQLQTPLGLTFALASYFLQSSFFRLWILQENRSTWESFLLRQCPWPLRGRADGKWINVPIYPSCRPCWKAFSKPSPPPPTKHGEPHVHIFIFASLPMSLSLLVSGKTFPYRLSTGKIFSQAFLWGKPQRKKNSNLETKCVDKLWNIHRKNVVFDCSKEGGIYKYKVKSKKLS